MPNRGQKRYGNLNFNNLKHNTILLDNSLSCYVTGFKFKRRQKTKSKNVGKLVPTKHFKKMKDLNNKSLNYSNQSMMKSI